MPEKNKSRYNLILLDYSFGEGPDGITFLEKLKQMNINIPVVFLTSFDEKYIRIRAAELGVNQFLSKYDFLQMANLTNVVSGIIDNPAF
ncbi:MAG: response regulator [Acidobacteria bacterium]|nr:response regulator [Acidobacteriota bacterium]